MIAPFTRYGGMPTAAATSGVFVSGTGHTTSKPSIS